MTERRTGKVQGLREAAPLFEQPPSTAGQLRSAATLKAPSYIVCIGASAGGLDPIEQIVGRLKKGSSAAYVIIQHLSPDFKSLMDQLLGRITDIPVEVVEDGVRIEPDMIYLIPPRKEMLISGGQLLLSDQDKGTQGPPLPINTFLRSLAEELQDRAIAVILSGSGSDGALGARDVAEAGGTVLVQEPKSASFHSMPSSVVSSGIEHQAMTPELIADKIELVINSEGLIHDPKELASSREPIDSIIRSLVEHHGIDFNHYKIATVHRRVSRRCELVKAVDLVDYAWIISSNSEERERLYFDLLINVTGFFREAEAFHLIRDQILPDLLMEWPRSKTLRLWVPACATGEEAYTLAIMLSDFGKQHDLTFQFSIFATDVHRRSIDAASLGVYSEEQLNRLTRGQIRAHFEPCDGSWKIRPELRKRIVFSRHDLLKDPPFTNMDFVSCRNLLIYFDNDAQRIAISRLHFALKKNGTLFLGTSEALGEFASEFEVISARWRIFKKVNDRRLANVAVPNLELTAQAPLRTSLPSRLPSDTYGRSVYQSLIESFVPDGFLINAAGKLVHTFGAAGKLLAIREGEVTGRLQDLLAEHLRALIASGIQKTMMTRSRVSIRAHDKERGALTMLRIMPMGDLMQQFEYFYIAIDDPRPAETEDDIDVDAAIGQSQDTRVSELELELSSTEETLQAMIEEQQAANEELQAANEELQSTNEELHSVNEELYTVGAEHQERVNELTELSYDMDNLLKSLNLPLVFLNERQEVRRFTPAALEAFYFSTHDLGRPIGAIRPRFTLGSMDADLNQVLAGKSPINREVTDDQGRELMLCMQPYMVDPETCLGVVMTFYIHGEFFPFAEKTSQAQPS